MNGQVRHYIDFLDGSGYVEVKPPAEWKSLNIELSFTQDSARLSTNVFRWQGDSAENINTYITNGLSGGYGIFEGLPYKAVLECDGTFYDIVVACLDFTADSAQYMCDIVEVPIRETGKIDFLTDRADSFRFQYLASLSSTAAGYISASDYVDIFYMVGKYPQSMEILMSAMSVFVMVKETYETVKRIADVAAAVLGGLTGFIESLGQLFALIIYLIFVVIALNTLVQYLIDLIFPYVYYHRGMYVRTLLQRACAYLGLGFSSSIFASGSNYYDQVIIPPKNNEGVKVGFPSMETGYYDGTFGDLLRALIEQYNGEVKIIGNTLHFERKGSFANTSTFKIPEVKGVEIYGTNAAEVSANYVIEYSYDDIDLYDYDSPDGRLIQATCEPITVNNKKNVLLKGLTQRSIPFTLPKIKTTVTNLEITMTKVFNAFSGLASSISSLFGATTSSSPVIPAGANVFCLQLDTHFISEHKTFLHLGVYGKVSPVTSIIMGADRLLQEFHYSEIIKPIYASSQGNQWYRYKATIPLCCEEYLQIKDNNYATFQGQTARIISCKWNPYDLQADIEFEVNKKYTNNLQVRVTEPSASTIIL